LPITWTGSLYPGDDIRYTDDAPNTYVAAFTPGETWDKSQYVAYHYSVGASFTVTTNEGYTSTLSVDAQSTWSQTQEWEIHLDYNHHGFGYGHGAFPVQAQVVYLSWWCPTPDGAECNW